MARELEFAVQDQNKLLQELIEQVKLTNKILAIGLGATNAYAEKHIAKLFKTEGASVSVDTTGNMESRIME